MKIINDIKAAIEKGVEYYKSSREREDFDEVVDENEVFDYSHHKHIVESLPLGAEALPTTYTGSKEYYKALEVIK